MGGGPPCSGHPGKNPPKPVCQRSPTPPTCSRVPAGRHPADPGGGRRHDRGPSAAALRMGVHRASPRTMGGKVATQTATSRAAWATPTASIYLSSPAGGGTRHDGYITDPGSHGLKLKGCRYDQRFYSRKSLKFGSMSARIPLPQPDFHGQIHLMLQACWRTTDPTLSRA